MADNPGPAALTRRVFLRRGGSVALLLGMAVPVAGVAGVKGAASPGGRLQINSFLRIDSDGSVTVQANHSEFGNGAYTIIPMLVAEELEVPLSAIRLEAAPTRPEYYSSVFREYLTAGSITTFSLWGPLRTAGAQAKALLIDAAAAEWGVPATEISAAEGRVRAGERELGYGQLVAV
ncbi:MAG: molybdopterin cofactor-binding domain-containing protein, partial [Pseudomonadota bacterium]